MVVIFQSDRILLQHQVAELAKHIGGLVLNVGSGGYDRYSHLFDCILCIHLDSNIHHRPNVVADIHSLPFKEDIFDSIVCTQVLHHISQPPVAIQELHRVLKKEGYCLITESQTNELHEEPFDFWRITKFGIENLCKTCGLNIIVIKQRGGFFTMLAQQMVRYCIDRFNLYDHPIRGWLFNQPMKIVAKFLMFLDRLDISQANRKHTLDVCIMARK